jgi:hypothetical protein
MNSPADSVAAYIFAKDGNRPHLLEAAFAEDIELKMVVRTDAISFPPAARGRHALADTLVRRFNQTYENIYTFCFGPPPAREAASHSSMWLVAMSEKATGAVRVGCGRYDWTFAPGTAIVTRLAIRIDAMEVLDQSASASVMRWVSELPYPWCDQSAALAAIPALAPLGNIANALRAADS